MRQFAWLYVVGIMASVVLFGCKGGDGPQGPAGTALTGNMHGKVYAYDSFGNYLGVMSGVLVQVEGTSLAGTSDSLGAYVIAGVPTGTYTLLYSKAGYGTQKWQQLQFIGRGDYYLNSMTISGLPNFETSTATASISAGNLHVIGTVTGGSPPYQRRVIVYVGKTSSINPSVPASFVRYINYYIPGSANNYDATTSISSLMSNYGFVSGETIYVVAYSGSYYNFSYYDYATEKNIEPSFGTVARASSVVIP